MAMLSNNMKENRSSSIERRKTMMDAVVADVYSLQEIKIAAGEAAVSRKVNDKMRTFASRNQSSASLNTSLRRSLLTQDAFHLQQHEWSQMDALKSIIHTLNSSENPGLEDDVIQGIVISREDQLQSTNGRKTSIIKIGLVDSSSYPHYQPGGKIRFRNSFYDMF